MDGNKKRLVILGAGLLLLIVGGTVLAVMGRDTSPDLAEIKQMRKDLFDKMRSEEGKQMTDEQRRDMWRQYGETVKKLPFEKRKQLFQEKEQKSLKRLEEYYALQSEEDRKAYLDKKIQEDAQRRQEWEAKRQAKGKGDSPRGPRGADATKGDNQGQAEGTDPNNGRPQRDPAVADSRHRESLQMSTPEQRAIHSDYRYQVKKEAEALGLPVPRGGGPGGGFGGGGPRGGGPRGGGGPPAGNTPPPAMP